MAFFETVKITGNAGGIVDAAVGSTAPANAVQFGVVNPSGDLEPANSDASGRLLVNATATIGAAVPTQGDYVAFNSGGNLTGVSATNPLPVSGSFSVSGANAAASTTGVAVPTQAGYTGFDLAGNLVGVSATNPLPVAATLVLPAALGSTQATSPWVTTATIQGVAAVQGVVGATQSTSPWITTATIQGTVPTSQAAIAATQGTSPWIVGGVVSATQGTSPWVTTATIQGVAAVQGVVGATQSTSPWVTTATVQGVTAVQGIIGATQSDNWTSCVVGNGGAILDALITASTAPANGVATLMVASTAAPTVANGQSIVQQCDTSGNLRVNPAGQTGSFTSQVVAAAGIANTAGAVVPVLTVPAGKKWVFQSARLTIETSSTAATRTLQLLAQDGSGNIFGSVTSLVTQGAGITGFYTFAPAISPSPAGTVVNDGVVLNPFPVVALGPGMALAIFLTNGLHSDTIGIAANCIQYND